MLNFFLKLFLFPVLAIGGMALIAAQSVPPGTFAGGEGTEQSPYLIKNKQQLAAIDKFTGGSYRGLYFKQVEDIVFEDKDFVSGGDFYNEGCGWKPIGIESSAFMGSFDGAGKTIKGLRGDNAPSGIGKCKGLFGFVSSCIIKNVVLKDCSFRASGAYYCMVGGLVSKLHSPFQNGRASLITHNYVQGRLEISNFSHAGFVGGIVAESDWSAGGVISCNIAHVDIFSDAGEVSPERYYVGGIAGMNAGKLVNNKATGKISGVLNKNKKATDFEPCIGGIAGHNTRGGSVELNYAKMDLSTSKTAGGIVGWNTGAVISNISLCPSINKTGSTQSNVNVGRIVGKAEMGRVQANYAIKEIKIAPEFQWQLNAGDRSRDGLDFSNWEQMAYWKKVGFSFGEKQETPWVMGKDKLPTMYWFAPSKRMMLKNRVKLSVLAEKGTLLERVQQQFLRKKEGMEKEVQILVDGVFLNQKDSYVQKLTFIFDNYVKQNKLEESVPLQEMLEGLKTAKALTDLPNVELPVHAEKERMEFEKLLTTHSLAVIAQKKAEYIAFKEKYIAALTRLKSRLIDEKDIRNALVVENEIKAMKVDKGEDIEALFDFYESAPELDSVGEELGVHRVEETKGDKVIEELMGRDVEEIVLPPDKKRGAFVQLTIVTINEGTQCSYLAELDLLDERGNPLPRSRWTAKASSMEVQAENGDVKNLFDGDENTYWHSQYKEAQTSPPYTITIDLGKSEKFSKIRLKNRKKNMYDRGSTWGRPRRVEVMVSNTPL